MSARLGGSKPNQFVIAYGTRNFEESVIASEIVNVEFQRLFLERYGTESLSLFLVLSRGIVKDEWAILEEKVDAINNLGYKDMIGTYLEGTATEFYDRKRQKYVGL